MLNTFPQYLSTQRSRMLLGAFKMKLWYPEITPQNNLVNSKSSSSKVCGWFILATMCLTPFSSGRPQQILFSEIPIVFSAVAESKTPWQVIKRLALPISSSSCSRSPPWGCSSWAWSCIWCCAEWYSAARDVDVVIPFPFYQLFKTQPLFPSLELSFQAVWLSIWCWGLCNNFGMRQRTKWSGKIH